VGAILLVGAMAGSSQKGKMLLVFARVFFSSKSSSAQVVSPRISPPDIFSFKEYLLLKNVIDITRSGANEEQDIRQFLTHFDCELLPRKDEYVLIYASKSLMIYADELMFKETLTNNSNTAQGMEEAVQRLQAIIAEHGFRPRNLDDKQEWMNGTAQRLENARVYT
jgi:hypothetical protein